MPGFQAERWSGKGVRMRTHSSLLTLFLEIATPGAMRRSRPAGGEAGGAQTSSLRPAPRPFQLHPLVEPQVLHFMQVPLRTSV